MLLDLWHEKCEYTASDFATPARAGGQTLTAHRKKEQSPKSRSLRCKRNPRRTNPQRQRRNRPRRTDGRRRRPPPNWPGVKPPSCSSQSRCSGFPLAWTPRLCYVYFSRREAATRAASASSATTPRWSGRRRRKICTPTPVKLSRRRRRPIRWMNGTKRSCETW